MTYNDPGVVNTAYLLPLYGILQGFGFSNQAIAFGNYTVNAAGNDDNLFIYGDTGVQAYVATPTQARMPVGSQVLLGTISNESMPTGWEGNDTATYSGSALDETMTALAFYTFVNTISTVQYFDSFKTLTVAGNGGLDIAVMYDTSGVDSFTASDTSFRYTRSGVFNNIANGYDRVYAFNYFGGFDTATLNGSSGNDRLTSIANYSVLVTPTTLQQAIGFRTVIVNAAQAPTPPRCKTRPAATRSMPSPDCRVGLFQRSHRPRHRLRHGQRQRYARRHESSQSQLTDISTQIQRTWV